MLYVFFQHFAHYGCIALRAREAVEEVGVIQMCLELADVTSDTVMRDLDEWSSMIGLSLLNMAEKEYGVTLTFDELRHAITVQDLFDTIANKQK